MNKTFSEKHCVLILNEHLPNWDFCISLNIWFDSLAPPSVSVLVPLVSLKCLNFKAD